MDEILVGGISIYFLFVVILAILWFFLPFAIFGTKDKLNQLIDATNRTNILLEEIVETGGLDLKPGGEFERRPPSID